MIKKMLVLVLPVLFVLAVSVMAAGALQVEVLVTPGYTVSIDTAPGYTASYNFNTLDLGVSSNSVTAIRVENDGNVGVTLSKAVNSATDGWTSNSANGTDQFVLYCATSTSRPGVSDYAANTEFANGTGSNNLTGAGGTGQVSLGTSDTCDLWFRLDMPSGTTNSGAKTITVDITAAAQ